MSYYHHLIKSGSSYTARTTAFATATAITDTTILNALNTFDLGLISNGLDTKMKALYPFVGGTATTHKYNFMDARDLNVAYRLSFNGGWTHSANGALGNGTNTYADTFFGTSSFTNHNQGGIGIYSRTNENILTVEGSNNNNNFMVFPRFGGSAYFQTSSALAIVSVSDSLGLTMGSSIASNDRRIYKNGSKLITNTTNNPDGATTNSFYFGAGSTNSGANYFSNKQYAMALLTEGMTDTDQTNLYTLTQAFQTSLTRNV